MHVKVLYGVPVHERVDVFRADNAFQNAGEATNEHPDRGRFVIGEVAETGCMALRFDHKPATVGGSLTVGVACIDELVFVQDSAFGGVTLFVLLANEAARGEIFRIRIALGHRARLPDPTSRGERGSAVLRYRTKARNRSMSTVDG
jgi:hypothetical protein